MPLGLITVAAMMPKNWEIKLVDMNIESLTDEHIVWADMVFIGAMVVQKQSVLEVVSRAKLLGKPVVAGGPLFSGTPEEFDEIDHLILNEAEITLAPFLEDLSSGNVEAHLLFSCKTGHNSDPSAEVGPCKNEHVRFHVGSIFQGLPL